MLPCLPIPKLLKVSQVHIILIRVSFASHHPIYYNTLSFHCLCYNALFFPYLMILCNNFCDWNIKICYITISIGIIFFIILLIVMLETPDFPYSIDWRLLIKLRVTTIKWYCIFRINISKKCRLKVDVVCEPKPL